MYHDIYGMLAPQDSVRCAMVEGLTVFFAIFIWFLSTTLDGNIRTVETLKCQAALTLFTARVLIVSCTTHHVPRWTEM